MTAEFKIPDLTYADYLHLGGLLDLQVPRSDPPEHDETLFIIIHQTYELWFKQMLHELDLAGGLLRSGDLWAALHTLRRTRTILKTLVGQVDIIETMTPQSFESFRSRLDTASGFQSMQFRELEFRLGIKREAVLKYMPEGMVGRDAALARFHAPSLVDDLHAFLANEGFSVPADVLERDVTQAWAGDERMEDVLVEATRTRPDIEQLLESLLDIDEGLQEWRFRHTQLVRRTIGDKHGTGGSPGVEYLKKTIFVPAFADLWAVRSRF
ncbi:MAG: tryptophan 2,3-dioxygenase family protein [Phycisphaerales bacterium]|nr:tryptophan 2,3-dioxygenase family protein [Phycisphaerales bacterium]